MTAALSLASICALLAGISRLHAAMGVRMRGRGVRCAIGGIGLVLIATAAGVVAAGGV